MVRDVTKFPAKSCGITSVLVVPWNHQREEVVQNSFRHSFWNPGGVWPLGQDSSIKKPRPGESTPDTLSKTVGTRFRRRNCGRRKYSIQVNKTERAPLVPSPFVLISAGAANLV